MTQQQNNLLKLQTELSQFGLNPTEWTLEKIQSLTYLIKNKFDDSFALCGKLEFKNKTPAWKSIDLVAL
ncbi:hypothetical protein ACLVWU_14505 [Bdellovibrio sp. HCB290]|uniref:hypothetical protein n=1 Tax=Bdellovibrio sp. HCB290 TaxID=3394356 RepID=UPI0039B61E82